MLEIGLDAAALGRLTGLAPERLQQALQALEVQRVLHVVATGWLFAELHEHPQRRGGGEDDVDSKLLHEPPGDVAETDQTHRSPRELPVREHP